MMAARTCKAKVESRPCGAAVADRMLACCSAHTKKMIPTGTPGIYTQGSRYVVVWRYRGRQHKQRFRTMAEAKETHGRRNAGDRKPPNRQAFDEYAAEWLRTYRGRTTRGLSDNTRESYERAINKWAIPYFGRYRMSDIGPRDVREFVAHMESKGAKPPSVRRNLAPLKALFATAYEDEQIRTNPTQGVRLRVGREQNEDPQYKAMTREELGLVLAAVPLEWQPFFTFLAQTGLRISEAAGLVWGDVELGTKPGVRVEYQLSKKGGKRVRLKTSNSRRWIPLAPGMVELLLEHRAKRYTGDDGWLWPNTRGGPLHVNNARNRALYPVVRGVVVKQRGKPDGFIPPKVPGLEWVGFHSFRHTCASLLLATGKNVLQVSRWIGHADPAFTLRVYGHLMDEGLGEADFLDAISAGKGRLG